jgi:hypothetical protein
MDRGGSRVVVGEGGKCRLNVNSRTRRLLRYLPNVNLRLGRPQSQINVIIETEICRSFVSSVRRPRRPVAQPGAGPPPRAARPPPAPVASHHQSDDLLSEAN